jgi:hypothetical protein
LSGGDGVMTEDVQMTSTGRFKRSCVYAIAAVAVSTVSVFFLVLLESNAKGQSSAIGAVDVASCVLGFPLLLGWIVSAGIFGPLGSCATPTQILGVFLTPVISIPIDACLTFAVWEFFHRKTSRGLGSDSVLHIR